MVAGGGGYVSGGWCRSRSVAAGEVEVGGGGLKTGGRQPRNQAEGGAQGRQPHPQNRDQNKNGKRKGVIKV